MCGGLDVGEDILRTNTNCVPPIRGFMFRKRRFKIFKIHHLRREIWKVEKNMKKISCKILPHYCTNMNKFPSISNGSSYNVWVFFALARINLWPPIKNINKAERKMNAVSRKIFLTWFFVWTHTTNFWTQAFIQNEHHFSGSLTKFFRKKICSLKIPQKHKHKSTRE